MLLTCKYSNSQAFADEVMELVELDNLSDALVGFPGVTRLRTKQRKRLTIPVELVANPSITFMDELNTGMDARAAAIVMWTIRNTVDTGRTVVCTIHQPNIDIFQAFDKVNEGLYYKSTWIFVTEFGVDFWFTMMASTPVNEKRR